MFGPLIRKLGYGADLTEADHDRLTGIGRARQVGARQTMFEQGDRPEDVHLVLSGFACRYKVLPDGKHQILAIMVPGDFCDLHVAIRQKLVAIGEAVEDEVHVARRPG